MVSGLIWRVWVGNITAMSDAAMKTWLGRSTSAEFTVAMGRVIGAAALTGDVIALVGELGAGKTQMVRGLAEGAGIDPAAVASPTYVLVHEYEPPPGKPVLVHIDAYRLHTAGDLESIGWTANGGGELRQNAIVIVEWADRIGVNIGDDAFTITLTHSGDTSRDITVSAGRTWTSRWPALTQAMDLALGASSAPPVFRPCPICKAPAEMKSPLFPFCSKRCRTIDLGKWIQGDYRISRGVEEADLDEE